MTETVPEEEGRRASTEPGLEGEGDQFDQGGQAHADAEERSADVAREAEPARDAEADEGRGL
jgi:hypothetical protein